MDLEAYPPLFSGDQVQERHDRPGHHGRADRRLRPQGGRRQAVRGLHRRERRELLRDRPRWRRHLGPGDPELHPERSGADLGRRHRRLHTGRREQPRHDPQVRFAAVPAPGAHERGDQRDARRPVPGPEHPRRRGSASCSSSCSCSCTTECPASWRASPSIYYALVVYAIFRLVPVTLTLAGVAAFVLSVGMAVDANILIFERTKEELRCRQDLAVRRSRPASTAPGTRSSTRTCRSHHHRRRSCSTSGPPRSEASRWC